MLQVGVAKLDITPPVGVRMAGFAGRVFPSLAVHDPLWARAIVFDNGEARVGAVALDLIFAGADAAAAVRKGVASSLGIDPQGLLMAATHTHSGPAFRDDGTFTEDERAYWAALPERLVAVVKEAAAALSPARVGVASGWSAIGINRREKTPEGRVVLGRNHFGLFDPEVGVIRIDHASGEPMACNMNYACHAVCLMFDNYLTSADYPGFAVHQFEENVPGAMGIFFNGACGNINPREAGVGHGYASGGSFMIAERAGSRLAEEATRVWRKATPGDSADLGWASRTIALPTHRARAIRLAEEALRRAESAHAAEGPPPERNPYMTTYYPPNPERERRRLEKLREQGDAPLECEVQALKVGPVAFLGWPGEIFCDFGIQVKQQAPFRPTYTIGYANGAIGYVPTPEAFAEGGYEADAAAHLADDAGLVLVEQSLEMLNCMKR
ncbi:MAG: neutral/alkaline non-lysosomal ceramidase N-terminal domain-containing protein [Armatimonadetes bacterium]|nr:neutral/alkaline non-lysosomal ceramidase N-terminal domain-containing protein [Armatimonadota bacterium]